MGAQGKDDVVIRIRGLVNGFGSRIIHDHIDLDLRRGEVMGVVGGSGSGKSVLLRSIVGLNKPLSGSIKVFGQETSAIEPEDMRGLQLRWGVLFQDGALFSSQTVAENIQVPLRRWTNMSQSLMDEIAAVKIALVGLPKDVARLFPSELSGGMRKRAGLARALALDPELLFLDEPTAGLDPIGAALFDQLIENLQKGLGLTVFMVTHDIDTLRATTDRIAVLVGGKIKVGTIAYAHPRSATPGYRNISRAFADVRRWTPEGASSHGNQSQLCRGGRPSSWPACWALSSRFSGSPARSITRNMPITAPISPARSPGLGKGTAVRYNGIDVGRVSQLDFDPDDPKRVIVTHATFAVAADP